MHFTDDKTTTPQAKPGGGIHHHRNGASSLVPSGSRRVSANQGNKRYSDVNTNLLTFDATEHLTFVTEEDQPKD